MPKSLRDWLYYQALQWQMTGRAVKMNHGSVWHRTKGDSLDGYTLCGAWVGGKFRSKRHAGEGSEVRNPWAGLGHTDVNRLCRSCFSEEIPLLRALRKVEDD